MLYRPVLGSLNGRLLTLPYLLIRQRETERGRVHDTFCPFRTGCTPSPTYRITVRMSWYIAFSETISAQDFTRCASYLYTVRRGWTL
jgi:hypothetical protein